MWSRRSRVRVPSLTFPGKAVIHTRSGRPQQRLGPGIGPAARSAASSRVGVDDLLLHVRRVAAGGEQPADVGPPQRVRSAFDDLRQRPAGAGARWPRRSSSPRRADGWCWPTAGFRWPRGPADREARREAGAPRARDRLRPTRLATSARRPTNVPASPQRRRVTPMMATENQPTAPFESSEVMRASKWKRCWARRGGP